MVGWLDQASWNWNCQCTTAGCPRRAQTAQRRIPIVNMVRVKCGILTSDQRRCSIALTPKRSGPGEADWSLRCPSLVADNMARAVNWRGTCSREVQWNITLRHPHRLVQKWTAGRAIESLTCHRYCHQLSCPASTAGQVKERCCHAR